MRPEITNNNSGKSPYAFSNLVQQQFKHFNCYYHDAGDMNKFMQLLLKVDKSIIMKHLSSWREQKGCHGNDNENGATAAFRFR